MAKKKKKKGKKTTPPSPPTPIPTPVKTTARYFFLSAVILVGGMIFVFVGRNSGIEWWNEYHRLARVAIFAGETAILAGLVSLVILALGRALSPWRIVAAAIVLATLWKFFPILLILAAVGVAGWFGWKYRAKIVVFAEKVVIFIQTKRGK